MQFVKTALRFQGACCKRMRTATWPFSAAPAFPVRQACRGSASSPRNSMTTCTSILTPRNKRRSMPNTTTRRLICWNAQSSDGDRVYPRLAQQQCAFDPKRGGRIGIDVDSRPGLMATAGNIQPPFELARHRDRLRQQICHTRAFTGFLTFSTAKDRSWNDACCGSEEATSLSLQSPRRIIHPSLVFGPMISEN